MGAKIKQKRKRNKKKSGSFVEYPDDRNPFALEETKKEKKAKSKTKKEESCKNLPASDQIIDKDALTTKKNKKLEKKLKKEKKLKAQVFENENEDSNSSSESLKQTKNSKNTNKEKRTKDKKNKYKDNEMSHNKTEKDGNNTIRMYRSSSVSKRKNKKLKLKIAKRIKKKKRENIEDIQADVTNTVVRRPTVNNRQALAQPRVAQLQREVHEVTESARNSIAVLEQQQRNELQKLLENTDSLKESADKFKMVSKEIKYEEKSRSMCCSVGYKWRKCFYRLKCVRGDKVKSEAESNSRRDEIADRYEKINKPQDGAHNQPNPEMTISRASLQSQEKNPFVKTVGSKSSLNSLPMADKLKRFKEGVRGSLPQIDRLKESSLLSTHNRGRKYSSTSSLDNLKTDKKLEKERLKREAKIQLSVEQLYEDEESRRRAASLMRLDSF